MNLEEGSDITEASRPYAPAPGTYKGGKHIGGVPLKRQLEKALKANPNIESFKLVDHSSQVVAGWAVTDEQGARELNAMFAPFADYADYDSGVVLWDPNDTHNENFYGQEAYDIGYMAEHIYVWYYESEDSDLFSGLANARKTAARYGTAPPGEERKAPLVLGKSPGTKEISKGDAGLELTFDGEVLNYGDKRIHLTGKETAILALLWDGKPVTKQQILNHLYNGIDAPELRIVDVFLMKLDRKIMQGSGESPITVTGDTVYFEHPDKDV
jgi:hypothetical protein